jgi:L-arabinokinase
LSELTDAGGAPLQYAESQRLFRRDPAQSWAAYVVGCLLVLMHEHGVRPVEGLSVLVHSEVPEGKGVSSSAAVEVATMMALCQLYDVEVCAFAPLPKQSF